MKGGWAHRRPVAPFSPSKLRLSTHLGDGLADILVHGLARLDARQGPRQAVEGTAHQLLPRLVHLPHQERLSPRPPQQTNNQTTRERGQTRGRPKQSKAKQRRCVIHPQAQAHAQAEVK